MVFLTLVIVGVICLVFKSTRTIGVIGITFLLLLYPLFVLCLLMLCCFYLFYQYKLFRRNLNVYEQPKLSD